MLKLLKHDIKDSWREILILNGIQLVLAFILYLGLRTDIRLFSAIGQFGWIVSLIAVSVMLLLTVIKLFHRRLFTDYGYLTLTTPISIDKILISKILISMLWVLTTLIAVGLSFVLMLNLIGMDTVGMVIEELIKYIGVENVVKWFVLAFIYIFYTIMFILFILVFANTGRMKKYKLVKGILMYVLLSVLLTGMTAYIPESASYPCILILYSVMAVLFYIGSRQLITHKLELE